MAKKPGGQSDTAARVGGTTVGSSNYKLQTTPFHNWDGTLVTPEESNNGSYYAQLEQHARANTGSLSEFLTGAGRAVAGVGLMGAMVAAPALAPVFGGGIAGAAAAGAVGGAASSTLGAKISNKPVTIGGVGKGAAMGAVTGGLAAASAPATTALTGAGVPSPLAAGIVKGGIGAGVGALKADLSGGNIGGAALSGGANGFLSGAVGNATGSNVLGKVAAGLGGMAISPFLGSGAGVSAGGPNMQTYSASVGQPTASVANPSTDTSLASTITGALPGVLQGAAGVYGAQNAAQAQQTADNSAINTQQQTMGNIQNIWNTQQQTGQGANTALQSSLGLGGAPADPSNFLNMPGYQFAVQQGTQAIQRQAASMGNAYTPNTAEAVGQYVTGTAAQDYNTYIQQLMGAAGLGTTANQGLQTGQQTTGNNISQLQQNIGQAQASGVQGAANAVGGIFGVNGAGTSLIGAAGRALTGGGSSGGGANGSGVGGPAGTIPFGGDVNGGVNPSTGVPYDLSPGGQPTNTDWNSDPFGGQTADPNWNSLTGDSTNIFGGGSSGWSSVVDPGSSYDPTSFLGDGL